MKTGGKHPDLISAYRKVKENLYSVSRKKEYQTFFFFFIFLILYKIGDFIWEYIELHKLFGYAIQSSYNFLIEIIPAMTAWFFSLLYENVNTTAGGVVNINGQGIIYLAPGCSGLKQMLLIIFILICYPISIKLKTFLLPVSVVIIFLAVILHFVLLVPVALYYPDLFLLAHDYFMIVLFYGFFFLTWVLWEKVRNIYQHNKVKE